LFVRQQPLEDVDRAVERRADGTVLRVAVPPAVLELVSQQAFDDALHVLPEVDAEGDGPAVDARLDLAGEERLALVLPTAVVPDLLHGPTHAFVVRVDPERAQQRERGFGRGPGLALFLGRVARGAIPPPTGEERASVPLPVVSLQGQQPGAPPLGRHPRALPRDGLGRRIGEITQRLPPDGGVGVEQPVQHGHAPSLRRGRRFPVTRCPQRAAFFTSAPSFFSSAGVNLVSA
jgi:hypothetical protein